MVERKEYLERLAQWKDEQVIKVITGIRRCGKSTLLLQYQAWLKANGVSADQIVSVNFEELEYEELLDYRKLYEYLKSHLCIGKKTYIFLDEIQKVAAFEKVVDSLYVKPDIDIYITGSNAYMLSSDLATLLTGRYVEIKMLPLSFKEFLSITDMDTEQGLAEYLRNGGLPYIAVMNRTSEKVETYLEGIYNTVIVKDIEDRQARKESDPFKRKITDIVLLKTIAKYLASVAGNPVSIRSITNYLTSNGRKLSPNTVSDYVDALIESFIFYPAERFDIVGKQLLKANRKLYIVDLGLRNYILPRQNYDLGFSLENIVFFELLRRGYRVMIGKVGNTEVDFVAEKNGVYSYIQVTADMTAKETFERELKPLSNIRDNYEKIVLTADRFTPGNYNGIQVKYLPDWLLGKDS
ncbi:ATP-binding protein [Firmicutes bacterium AM29-6AC]|uniref:ATPase n=1 Tax=Anaerotignum faecicola TaxID=2358141 RepID=A0A401LEL0_9FIRM|nr:ATP-binding protein [Anaerotignum faecicola]RHR12454.1 ATP-binding protein [Firmicutes bacterium AF19-2LB]RHT37819.1 ATP-binding protein [Firmicutes bacterium AM29-6AC]GCB29963.1 ATPase [Anaerotignum faecicola]